MATLSSDDKDRIWRGLMRFWSSERQELTISKGDLWAAVAATDTWIDGNQTDYNQALPAEAQSQLGAAEKTLLFCAVALARVNIPFLRQVLGEVD
jgi:hypothetical protein